MSKDQNSVYLCYGQGILMQGFTIQSSSEIGILTSKGFADTGAKYQTIPDILYFKNYRNGIFEMLPAGNFQINDELLKLEETVTSTQEQQKKKKQAIETLTNRAKSQVVQFELGCKSKKMNTIKFGDYIIFKHVDSGTFLSGTIRPSDGSNGAFSVEVSNKYSTILIFQILPYRSFESVSMQIPFSSPFLLKNFSNNGFLTYEKFGMNLLSSVNERCMEQIPTPSDESFSIPVKTQSTISRIYETVTHFADLSSEKTAPMPWIFKLHFNDADNDSLIQHDIVYLKHTQNGGILSAIGQEIILKESKAGDGQFQFYESLWEIQKHKVSDDAYILRHLMSGMTLGIQKNENDEPIKSILIDISDGPEKVELGVIEIKLAQKNGEINSNTYVKICSGNATLDINENVEVEEEQMYSKSQSIIDGLVSKSKMKKLMSQELEYQVKRLHFSTQTSNHCFIIQEIENNLKEELLFALSFHSKIISLREDLKWGATEAARKISYLRMMQMTQKIKEIKNFLKDCDSSQADEEHIQPIGKRQEICKDLGISELLFQLMYFMRQTKSQQIFKQKHNQKEKFNILYNTCYEVIYELIRNNDAFKLHISKWLIFIFEDVINEDEEIQFKVLIEALKNNEFFVSNFVTEQLVSFLVAKMFSEDGKRDTKFTQIKYLQIFRKFCIVGQKVVTKNQIIILNQFIKKLESNEGEVYQLNFKNSEDGIMCYFAAEKKNCVWKKFSEFKYISIKQGSPWPYYLQYMNLLADMTQGRNKMTENWMASFMPLQLTTAFVQTEDIGEFQIPLIRLLHYLYVENEYFYPIEKHDRIIDYEGISSTEIVLNYFQGEKDPLEYMGPVLVFLMDKLNGFEAINPQNIKQNQTLQALLLLTKETINMGFWKKKEQLISIFDMIIKILAPGDMNYDEIQPIRKYQLMISCKSECLRIISLIIEYDVDISLKIINKVFEGYELPIKEMKLKGRLMEEGEDTGFAIQFLEEYRKTHEGLEKNIVGQQISTQILQLSKYKDPILTSQSLQIMEKVFRGQPNRIEKFYEQSFICEGDKVAFSKYLKSHAVQFILLEEPETPEFNMQTQYNNYFVIYKQDANCIMNYMYLVNELMKNEFNLSNIDTIPSLSHSGIYKQLASDCLLNFTNERTSSNLAKQKIVSSTNIHGKILTYITNCKQVPEEPLTAKLLHLCYRFIVGLIENHQQIKTQVEKMIPKMIHHLSCNVGCVDFFKEIYDNNKIMLYNETELSSLIRIVCENVDKNEGKFYKSKLLDFLRYLIYLNGKTIKSNQILILKKMQDDDFTNILIPVTVDIIKKQIQNYLTANANFNGPIEMSENLTYLITYWQILTSLVDQHNEVNIGKLLKNFPFGDIVSFISESKICWPLKRNLRAFLNRMYYFSPGSNAYLNGMIEREIPIIISDLDYFISMKMNSESEKFENLIFKNPVRYSYLESYFYLNFEETLFSLERLLHKKQIYDDLLPFLQSGQPKSIDTLLQLIRIAQRIAWLRTYFKKQQNVSTTSTLKFLIKRFESTFEMIDHQYFKDGLGEEVNEEGKKKLIYKILKGDISSFYENHSEAYKDKNPLVFSIPIPQQIEGQRKAINEDRVKELLLHILKRKKREFNTKDDEIAFKHEKVIKGLKLSPEVSNSYSMKFNEKVSQITKNQKSEVFDYVLTIIKTHSEDPSILPSNLKLFILKFIISVFENTTNLEERKEIDEWEAEDWEQSQSKIEDLQKVLKDCHVGAFLTELIKDNICDNIPLANNILLCGIAYLWGGNSQTQKNIIEQLASDQDNKFLKNIKDLILKLGALIRKNIDEEKASRDQAKIEGFSVTSVDNYDFYNRDHKMMERKNVIEERTTDEDIYYAQCIATYRRVFKFLQLMCENNNIQNKNFLREQDKNKTFNFIETATKELREIFIVLNKSLSDVPNFILEFICEVTQIPVKKNQEALMRSSFFEDLCFLNDELSKPQILRGRNLDEEEEVDKINQIYSKSVEIILNTFEGNDKDNYKLLDDKLQPQFMLNMLKSRLKDLKIYCKDDLIKKIDEDCQPQEGRLIAKTTFSDEIVQILKIMIIFMKYRDEMIESKLYKVYDKQKSISSNQGRSSALEGEERNIDSDIYPYLEDCLRKIQITDENGEMQYIYFPNQPLFGSLSDGLRNQVMRLVGRGTHRDKIVTLLSFVRDVKEIMEMSYQFQKCQHISEQNKKQSYNYAAIFSLIICVYMVIFYDVYIEYGGAEFTSTWPIVIGRFILSLIHLYFSCYYFIYWKKLRIWYTPQGISYDERSKPQKSEQQEMSEEKKPEQNEKQLKGVMKYVSEVKSKVQKKLDPYLKYLTTEEQTFYFSTDFYRIILFVVVSFLGTFVHPPLFFIHIIDIFCNSEILANIFQAIALGVKSLLYVSFMGVVFVVIFCTVTFSNYMKNVYEDAALSQMCDGMVSCILDLYVSGAIVETMDKFEISRFTYDMIYIIFFGLLFQNIVSGIILDAFGNLRDQTQELENDKSNLCYICNASRDKIEKSGKSFDDHIEKHFLWHYLFYIINLEEKPQTQFSGLQYYISQKYRQPDESLDVTWIPNGEQAEFDGLEKVMSMKEAVDKTGEELATIREGVQKKIKDFEEYYAKYEAE